MDESAFAAGRDRVKNLPKGITLLLGKWMGGDQEAFDKLIGLVYENLHAEAGRHLRKLHAKGYTLQPTVLVNEAYLKFREKGGVSFLSRDHFFWFASRMIRNIIVDHIRAKLTQKRGEDAAVPFDEETDRAAHSLEAGKLDPATFLALNEAISRLEAVNARRSQVVVLRFFMGSSIQETAEIMELSPTTVKTEWTAAKTWLFKQLTGT